MAKQDMSNEKHDDGDDASPDGGDDMSNEQDRTTPRPRHIGNSYLIVRGAISHDDLLAACEAETWDDLATYGEQYS